MGISSEVEDFLRKTLREAQELKVNADGDSATDDARILVKVESLINGRLDLKDNYGAQRKKSKKKKSKKKKPKKKVSKKKRTRRRR